MSKEYDASGNDVTNAPCPCAFHAHERELLDRIRVLADRNDELSANLGLAFASMRLCVVGHATDIEMIESGTITEEQATKILRDAGMSEADVDAAYERLMAAVDAKFPKAGEVAVEVARCPTCEANAGTCGVCDANEHAMRYWVDAAKRMEAKANRLAKELADEKARVVALADVHDRMMRAPTSHEPAVVLVDVPRAPTPLPEISLPHLADALTDVPSHAVTRVDGGLCSGSDPNICYSSSGSCAHHPLKPVASRHILDGSVDVIPTCDHRDMWATHSIGGRSVTLCGHHDCACSTCAAKVVAPKPEGA